MITAIENINIVTLDGVINNGFVSFDEKSILYVGDKKPSADKWIDGEGKYLLPGFIDIHCHGCLGKYFSDGIECFELIEKFHLSHGTTTMLATTATAPMDEITDTMDNYNTYKEANPDTTLAGLHLEGPWLNEKQCGAQGVEDMRKPNGEELRELKAKYPAILRVGAAPELDEGYTFSKTGVELGVNVSVAHSDAIFSEIEEALQNGYTLMTHLYSGMKGMERKNAYRIAGAIEAGLYFDDMYAEIISDGRHLPPELLRFIYKCKGADKLCLVTDATAGCGYPNGAMLKLHNADIIIEDDVAKLLDRTSFAGSTATYDRLLKTMANATGASWVDLMKMTSHTAAKIMKFDDRGEIAVGKKPDFVIIDSEYNLNKVIHNGKEV